MHEVAFGPLLQLLRSESVKVFGRLRDDLSARADGRRTKSANGRNRERWSGYSAAGSTRV